MFTLHKLPEGFIVTSSEEIKEGDLYWFNVGYASGLKNAKESDINQMHLEFEPKKVIAQQDQIDFSALSEDDCKKIGYFNLVKFKIREWNKYEPIKNDLSTEDGFKEGLGIGFQKAQELLSDRIFTLEDISRIFVGEDGKGGLFDDFLDYRINTNEKLTFKEWYLKQLLSQPKSWSVECIEENGKIKITKIL